MAAASPTVGARKRLARVTAQLSEAFRSESHATKPHRLMNGARDIPDVKRRNEWSCSELKVRRMPLPAHESSGIVAS